ncbi:MAG: HTTM domain-containing protein [Polyangia bacterium]
MVVGELKRALDRPVDLASLAVFRILFGVLMTVASVRFLARGWVATEWLTPRFFFSYVSFIRPLPGDGMYAVYVVCAACAVLVAVGFLYRPAIIVFATLFSYAHLCDVTNYLNHYYLVSLLALLMCFLPLDREYSLRVRLRPEDRRASVHAWALWLLRFQVAVVYVFGGLAKLGPDWLLRGEPLHIWLVGDGHLPLLSHIARAHWLALAFSWCGLLFDLSIVPLLLWSRSRPWAYAVVVAFHLMTSALFPIGMFPWIMSAAATLFFAPAWPRRWAPHRAEPRGTVATRPLGGWLWVVGVYAIVQLVVPLRHLAYPGNTLWTEEGFRWSWRVMLIDKVGDLELEVVDAHDHRFDISPSEYLTPTQRYQASTQPDLILAFAHLVADDFVRRGRGPVRVYAHTAVTWNGRRHAPIVDPTVDLVRLHDGLLPKPWILPAPTTEPRW